MKNSRWVRVHPSSLISVNPEDHPMVPNNRIRRFWRNFSESNPPIDFARCRMTLPLAKAPPWMPDVAHIHALLHERLTSLRRPPRSLWSRIWRFVRGIKA